MSTSVILWLIAVVIFVIAEAVTVALVSIWFIGGAICALIAASLGAGTAVQLALFVGVSALLLAFAYPAARKRRIKKPERMNADRLVGQTALVTETIDAQRETGEVKIGGVFWTARCPSGARIPIGSRVYIEAVQGAKLYVEPVAVPCETQ